MKLCRDIGGKWALADALGHLGMVAQQQGHYDQALDCSQESLTLRDEMGDQRTQERPPGVCYYGVGNKNNGGLWTRVEDKRGIDACREKLTPGR